MNPDDFPAPAEGFVLTHFLVVSDQDRSREFYRFLFDGQVVSEHDPVILKVANSWLILNEGGGPTDDKPTVTLTTPPDPNRTTAFLNVRVADIARVYKEWSAKGAEFLIEPKHHPLQHEWVRRMRKLPHDLRRDIQAFSFAYCGYIPEVLAQTQEPSLHPLATTLTAFGLSRPRRSPSRSVCRSRPTRSVAIPDAWQIRRRARKSSDAALLWGGRRRRSSACS
jgi:hypothetical protein